jgi:hypothetical protein
MAKIRFTSAKPVSIIFVVLEVLATMHCFKHALSYSFGRCPKCLEEEVKGNSYAKLPKVGFRWSLLLSNPCSLNQDQFGICGMSSAFYLLLKHDKTRARELYEAAFADLFVAYKKRKFATAGGHAQISIPFRYLARRYRLMQEFKEQGAPAKADQIVTEHFAKESPDKEAAFRASAAYPAFIKKLELSDFYFVDFCVPRALGYVFKKVAKSRYEGEKRQFNLEFSENTPMNYQEVTHLGNFALRTNNLAFIFKEILGADVRIVSKTGAKTNVALAPAVGGVTTTNFSTADDLLGEFQAHFPGKGKFAVAAVFGDLCKQEDHVSIDSPAGTKAGSRLAYNHWVVINGFSASGAIAKCANKHANLQVWTWAKDYQLQVCEGHLLSYIQDVIFGEFT